MIAPAIVPLVELACSEARAPSQHPGRALDGKRERLSTNIRANGIARISAIIASILLPETRGVSAGACHGSRLPPIIVNPIGYVLNRQALRFCAIRYAVRQAFSIIGSSAWAETATARAVGDREANLGQNAGLVNTAWKWITCDDPPCHRADGHELDPGIRAVGCLELMPSLAGASIGSPSISFAFAISA
jgi:hypothetical protein